MSATRNRSGHIPVAERYEKKLLAWRLSLDGWSGQKIAERLKINRKTVYSFLREMERESAEERALSGEARADLEKYIANMRKLRTRHSTMYAKLMNRLEKEEELEALHEEDRAKEGKLPTVMPTRALQFYFSGISNAINASVAEQRTVEAEGRVLGLEQLGKEEAERGLQAKLAEMMGMLEKPLTIEVRVAEPPPPGWDDDDPEDDDMD